MCLSVLCSNSEACRVNGWDREAYFELKSLGDSAKLSVHTSSGTFKSVYKKFTKYTIIVLLNLLRFLQTWMK